jgi:dihydroneopterin aldolase
VQNKSFKLIEHLACLIYEILYQDLNSKNYMNTKMSVTIIKKSPPVPGIYGGVSFTYLGTKLKYES